MSIIKILIKYGPTQQNNKPNIFPSKDYCELWFLFNVIPLSCSTFVFM